MQSRKYSRTYHFPFSKGTTSDDRIQRDWESILQQEIVITEKLDGENTCLKNTGVFARSHAAPTRNPWAKNMWQIWEQVKNDLGELEVFGENLYGIHSIEYTHLKHHFYIFAIREGDTWLSWEDVKFYAALMELPTVPVFQQGRYTADSLQLAIAKGMEQGSTFGGACEGFVCRNIGVFGVKDFSKNVLKYVRKNHVKTNEHWTRNWKRAKLWFEQSSTV